MASIFHEDGGWVVKFKDGAGAWRKKRTTCETKAEAKKLAADLERQAERQREGLDAMPSQTKITLAELCRWWLKRWCPERSRQTQRQQLERHVCAHQLGDVALPRVRAELLEALLAGMERPDGKAAAPATMNRVRTSLHSAFERARKAKLWTGTNPLVDVELRRVPKRAYATLRAEEVPVLLPHVEATWRNFFAAGLWTALRKGELCGLLKTDVDLSARLLTVARSYDHDTTKGGRAAVIPIAEPLVPYLEDAIKRSPSAWVFPDVDGKMRTEECDPQKVLRTALGRAGLVVGYAQVCRRCKARGEKDCSLRFDDDEPRHCERCGMKRWVTALPRPLRFHDLRHTTATLLLRAKVDLHRVQRIVRHANIATTIGIYGHLDVEDLRDAVNQLPAGPTVPALEPLPLAACAEIAPLGPPVVRRRGAEKAKAGAAPISSAIPASYVMGDAGFEPATPTVSKADRASDGLASSITPSYQRDNTRLMQHVGLADVAPGSTKTTALGPPVVRRFRALPGGADRLLTVREVAARLSISTATVYKLVESAQLPHARISNAIRVAPADLAAFIAKARR